MAYSSSQELFSEPERDSPESPYLMRTSGSSDEEEELSCEPDMGLLFQPLTRKQQPTDCLVR